MIEVEDGEEKPYKFTLPLMPLLPVIGMWVNSILSMFGSTPFTWILLAIFESCGLLVYICYGYKHSKLEKRIEKHMQRKKEEADKEE